MEENGITVLESEKEKLETELKKYTRIDKLSFGWGWLSKDPDYYYYNDGKFELLGKYDGYINATEVFTSRNYVLDMGEKTTTVSITKHNFKKGGTGIVLLELEESTKKDYKPSDFERPITNWRVQNKKLEEKSNLYTKNKSSGGSKKRKQRKTGRKRKSKRTKTNKKFV